MARKSLAETQLSEREREFCHLVAYGWEPGPAYRRAYRSQRVTAEVSAKRAEKLLTVERIKRALHATVAEIQIADLDSPAHVLKDVLQDYQAARSDKQWTAIAALARIRAQIQGLLKDTVVHQVEHSLSDDALVRELTVRDRHAEPVIRGLLGAPAKFGMGRGKAKPEPG